jgi:GntR family transcriptional regulator
MTEEIGQAFQGKIDVNSHMPYYLQLKREISRALGQGVWQPDDQIPSEADLCAMFDVSRTVVRHALDELEYEELIKRVKGKGTFVTRPKIREGLAQKLTGFYQDMIDQGLQPFTKTLRRQVVPSNAKIAQLLDIEPGTLIFDIERLRFVDNEPLLLGLTYIQYDVCPGLIEADLSTQSLYAFLEQEYGIVIAYARRTIEAVVATEYEAQLLGVQEGAALLMLRSLAFLEDGRPIEYFRGLHRGDRSCFEIELIRD